MDDKARKVWREGFAPIMSTPQLVSLAQACRTDDQRLVQGSTTTPPPLMCVQDWPCEAGCGLAYPVIATHGGFDTDERGRFLKDEQGNRVHNPGACSVQTAEEGFARLCFDADERLGESHACRWFLNWFDDTPRDEMRSELLKEIELALSARQAVAA